MNQAIPSFFKKSPALLYALFLCFSLFAAFGNYYFILVAFPILIVLPKKEKCIVLILFLLGFCYVKSNYYFPPEQKVLGEGEFHIKEVKKARKGWSYKGEMKSFHPANQREIFYRNIPCSLYSSSPLDCNTTYRAQGELKELFSGYYGLKTKAQLEPVKKRFSFASWRYDAKAKVREYITTHTPFRNAASFLSGLATGGLEDNILQKEFEKRGLSHLLAISGFHFALLGSCFYFLLRPFLKPKMAALILLGIVTSYFFFIGNAPSVQRAWMICVLFLLGTLIERPSFGVNSLGFALMIAFLINPLSIMSAGLCLSYMATFAILILFRPIEKHLRTLFMPSYAPVNWTREAIALVIAIYLALFPLLLFLFHKLPLHGILYNLFFPFLVSIACLALIVSTLFHFLIPPLGVLMHKVNGYYTEGILELLEIPLIPHKTLYVESFPLPIMIIYWMLLFGGAIYLREREAKRLDDERDDFRFF